MLIFANIPQYFWAEATTAASFTQNRSLINNRLEATPYEAMNKRKPNIKFFHIFGFRCYLKNNKDQLWKFAPKADEGIFLGYCLHAAAYRVLNKRTRVIEERSDVPFHESYVRVLDPNHYGPQMVVPFDKMNQPSPANASAPVHAFEVDFDFLFPTQPSALESEKLTKTDSPNVSQPNQSSKVSSSTKALDEGEPSSEHSTPTSHHQFGQVITPVTATFEGEPPLNGSILKGTLQSSQPSSPWFQGEPHSTGSSPSISFTSTPSIEFNHATFKGEPPVSSSFGLFQDDLFEGTFTSDYPSRPREQYEVLFTPQIHKEARLTKWTKDHPVDQIICDLDSGVVTRSATKNECLYAIFLSMIDPKGIKEALEDADWVKAMKEELAEFKCNNLWDLVPTPEGVSVVGSRWVYRNKSDEDGVIIRNKARLVVKGYSQQKA
uniref:Reverse transcriptase Ty1/copia-type domain-containing protein n=1 Tax=Lactuca sativa TaxID=4236 RepID=A0A9R1VLY8_LACSA|nr:hypothetical protein LSAT_V11C400218990 [Lactuca sativa]